MTTDLIALQQSDSCWAAGINGITSPNDGEASR